MKSQLKNYFVITKTDWNGLVILILLIAGVLVAPWVYEHYHHEEPINVSKFNRAVAQLQKAGVTGENIADGDETETHGKKVVPFRFNPNKLSVAQWQKLGLSPQQIKGIKNYEAKGGKFFSKADVEKMYTLTAADYKRLETFIALPKASDEETHIPVIIVELNTADSAALTQLKGIGPAFARRIVQYRNRLGGFHSKLQLKEIYGLDEVHYRDIQNQFTLNKTKIKRLDVNTAEYEDLKSFPYLSYKQINALVQYRKQHGNYESFDELRNVAILDDDVLRKIKPYILIKP